MKLLLLFILSSMTAVAQTKKDSWQLKYEKENNVLFIDTVLMNEFYDTTLCVVYVIKCDTCEVKLLPAYKIQRALCINKTWITVDPITRKPFTDLKLKCPWNLELLKYLRYDGKEFDKSWKIIKEKEL